MKRFFRAIRDWFVGVIRIKSRHSTTFTFPNVADVARFCKENWFVVKKIRVHTHKVHRRYRKEGELMFFNLVCARQDGREHHVYCWVRPETLYGKPITFRQEMKAAEPEYFGVIGLPGITILDPGESGQDECEYMAPTYKEIKVAFPEQFMSPPVKDIPETDEDWAILEEVKGVDINTFRVVRAEGK